MTSWPARAALFLLLIPALAHAEEAPLPAMTEEDAALVGVGTATVPMGYVNKKDPWIDRVHNGVFNAVWRSAMHVDQWFGSTASAESYQRASGSIAPAVLYDDFDGFRPSLRFQVDLPLPRINERFHAFIGRVNPDEYVTERKPESGAFARQYGPAEEDATLFGIRYRDPKQGGRFEADAGLRIRSPLDPFVKGSWRFQRGTSETTLLSLRETAFWQNSEKFGATSRFDIERVFSETWLLRWTVSATISQRTEGVRGYTSLTALLGLSERRAIGAELFTEGEFDADVPLGDYGMKVAYRRSVLRDWLVLETRLSLTFPRDELWQVREATWGVGVGLEMYFGTDNFRARPVTF